MAKRLLVDAVYSQANLEGIAVTFAQTIDILNNVSANLSPSEIGKICCLRDGWKYILENLDKPMDLAFLEELHILIAKSELSYKDLGTLRKDSVLISGTSWRPELPQQEKLHKELLEINALEDETDRALTLLLWIMRSQIFLDGNKRVAQMAANKILIECGRGILVIPVELDGKFKTQLVDYYQTNKSEALKQWLYDNCLEGTTA